MDKTQSTLDTFIRDLRKIVYKVDPKATVAMISLESHHSKNSGEYEYDGRNVRTTVFHNSELVYAYDCTGIPTTKQFKQVTSKNYRDWLNKQNSTA